MSTHAVPAVLDSVLGRMIGRLGSKPRNAAVPDADPLLAFASEQAAPSDAAAVPVAAAGQKPRSHGAFWALLLAFAVVVTAGATFAATRLALSRATIAPRPGTLTMVSRPAGASVTVDGEPRGVTPLALSLTPGTHTVTIRSGSNERVLPITISAGADVVRDLEMAEAAPPLAATAGLSVTTDPPGAHVVVDGTPAGTSPVIVEGLAADAHTVTVTGATGSATRTVSLAAGQTSAIVFSLPKVSGPVGGWLSVAAPFDVQVIEKGETIGTGGAAKIMLAAGRHDVVLANRTLEYEESRVIEISPGGTTTVRVDPPKITLSINARPWADVSIDGHDIGQTPIANVAAAVGTHQIVFRHPQLGERNQSVVLTGKGPNRIAVDLTK